MVFPDKLPPQPLFIKPDLHIQIIAYDSFSRNTSSSRGQEKMAQGKLAPSENSGQPGFFQAGQSPCVLAFDGVVGQVENLGDFLE